MSNENCIKKKIFVKNIKKTIDATSKLVGMYGTLSWIYFLPGKMHNAFSDYNSKIAVPPLSKFGQLSATYAAVDACFGVSELISKFGSEVVGTLVFPFVNTDEC